MKIILTGGGTGGHFYPIVAVAQSIRKIIKEEKYIDANLYYFAPSPYNERLLVENDIVYKKSFAGKVRRYFSILNVLDIFKTFSGIMKALVDMYNIFPDVVFGKGGYVSFPILFAARFFGIPVVIHESDSKPGKVNMWAGKFAARIAISYPEAIKYFPNDRVAHTGNPIRKEIAVPENEADARKYFNFEPDIPVVLFMGGSQGSRKINDVMIDMLPALVEKYYVIHQTGNSKFDEMSHTADVVLKSSKFKDRYKPYAYLNDVTMKMAVGASKMIVSRAGSVIFEIATWSKPSIIIPIPEDVSHDQRSNAFSYASTGACSVIEEMNLTSNILLAEMNRINDNPNIAERMINNTDAFKHPDASDKIARAVLNVALEHIV